MWNYSRNGRVRAWLNMLAACNDTGIRLWLKAALTELDAPTIEASVY
jgi:hypothetical protein